ncbi:MAG: Glu-tRNA(Gln) amidotransferase subunit GatD [Candidatus Poseidoniaceae archaeon]|nr:Glu-tRNA(Gln) amidotransferase subunit GatD [Candidatus Poseidoniaceae archaeon]
MVDVPDDGSRVLIEVESHNGSTKIEGFVIPAAAAGHITIKLVNGYNASYAIDSITSLEIVENTIEKASTEQSPATKFNESLPTVRILHTGGTIASKVDYKTGAVVARFEPEELISSIPELTDIANVEAVKLGNMFSDDMRPQHWNKIIDASKQAFEDGVDGIVVTHGTDTMHYTAAALSFSWAGSGGKSPRPIAIVGSQRSSDRGSSDAAENLIAAVHWAANAPSPIGGSGDSVVVVMHTSSNDGECSVHPGIGVRKMHSTRRDAFRGINTQPLAIISANNGRPSIQLSETYSAELELPITREVTTTPDKYETEIRIPQFIAGPWLVSEHIDAIMNIGCQAIVIHGTGLGHLPIDDPEGDAPENTLVWRSLTRAINREVPVVIVNQCISGPIDMNVYSKGRKQMQMGILGHGIIAPPETVVAKLHWALSKGEEISSIIAADLCGEGRATLME